MGVFAPRRARCEMTLPTETFWPLAIPRARFRTSASIFNVVRILMNDDGCSRLMSSAGATLGANMLDATMDTAKRADLIERIKMLGAPSSDRPLPLVTLEEFFVGNDD